MNWKIVATAALIAGTSSQALAQGAPAPPAQPTAQQPDSIAAARAAREQQEGFDRLARDGVQINNAERQEDSARLARQNAPRAATAADLTAGATVRATDGLQVATIERLEADGAVVRVGDRLAKLPLDAFGKNDAGLMIAVTAAEFQTAIAASSVPVPAEEPEIVAATAADMTPGAPVRDIEGAAIGTVQEMVESGVILLADGKKVKLALDSFAKDENGLLIGITATEFRAIIHNARPATPAG
jgi:hypothetical protein